MTPGGTVKSASPVELEAAAPATGRATVSVVMCVYAGDRPGPFRDAVRSVLEQTFADLVLRIYVDGPVETGVRAFLEALDDPRVRVEFAAANRGLGAGLNRLIDDSLRDGCDVIARMDADDVCHPERLAKQLAFLERHPEVAVLGAGCLEFDEDTGEELVKLLPPDDGTLKRELVKRTPFVHPTVVFRAEVFSEGIRYSTHPSEDMHLWVDLTRYGWTFANLEEPLLRYRVSRDLFRRRSSWSKAMTELRARLRAMNELCMASPGNVVWTGAYLGLRLLPAALARPVYRYLRPRTARA